MAPAIGLAHLSAIELDPTSLVDLAADSGYSSVALRLHSAAPGTPVYPLKPGSQALHSLREHAIFRGITISEVELVPLVPDLEPLTLKPLLSAAAELGAGGLIVTGDTPDRNALIARFQSVCELAALEGLLVHLEFMRWRDVANLADALDVVTRAQADNGRILIDVLHLMRSGGKVSDLAKLPAGSVDLVQVCDATATLQGDIITEARSGRLIPGDGVLPIASLLSSLAGDWELAMELPGMGQGGARRQALIKARRRIEEMYPVKDETSNLR